MTIERMRLRGFFAGDTPLSGAMVGDVAHYTLSSMVDTKQNRFGIKVKGPTCHDGYWLQISPLQNIELYEYFDSLVKKYNVHYGNTTIGEINEHEIWFEKASIVGEFNLKHTVVNPLSKTPIVKRDYSKLTDYGIF